jgi:two-component system, OmpR family, response regulator BaeR
MNTTTQHWVLVVEDDPKISQLLLDYLRAEDIPARAVADGLQAVTVAEQDRPAVILLDLMLPGLDGVGVCRAVREFSDAPIIMVTARVDEIDRVMGLETGADDYVCKPFSPREVMARVKAQLRRVDGQLVRHTLPWLIDSDRMRASWRGQWLSLTAVEFRMLRLLAGQPGRVYSRAQLLDHAHDNQRDVSDRAIDSHIKNIRRKIDAVDPGCTSITSTYGVGYCLEIPAPPVR